MWCSRSVVAVAAVSALVALAAACGDDSGSGDASTTAAPTTSAPEVTTTAAPTTTSIATTTTTAAGPVDVETADFPETPLTDPLEQTYPVGAFDEATFGLAPGSITAAWYRAGDRWAVHYEGLRPETASGKCPGNSLETPGGFEHVSNSPYGALACAGFTTNVLPPGSVVLCAATEIAYVTEIPIDAEGTLWGSLEQGLPSGIIQGMTSQVVADAAVAPEIDVSNCQVIS
jgi:hypothetical protein